MSKDAFVLSNLKTANWGPLVDATNGNELPVTREEYRDNRHDKPFAEWANEINSRLIRIMDEVLNSGRGSFEEAKILLAEFEHKCLHPDGVHAGIQAPKAKEAAQFLKNHFYGRQGKVDEHIPPIGIKDSRDIIERNHDNFYVKEGKVQFMFKHGAATNGYSIPEPEKKRYNSAYFYP